MLNLYERNLIDNLEKPDNSVTERDVIIIGAGAAGLMCAAEAAGRGRKVTVLELSEKPGKKILISGGGRCNFTNRIVAPGNFISENPHFCRSALSGYTPDDFIEFVRSYKINFHEKKLGQLFCDGSSREILNMLLDECRKYGAEIITDCRISEITKNDSFLIKSSYRNYRCRSLVIASGGLSIPKMGATDFGYRTAEKFEIKIVNTKPALVPLVFENGYWKEFSEISGVSVDSEVSAGRIKFRENILFTHRGLSGPAVLQISSFIKEDHIFRINLLPEENLFNILTDRSKGKLLINNLLSEYFPKRFSDAFVKKYFSSKPVNQFSHKDLRIISDKIHRWELNPSGTEGYGKAEVTSGGIDTNELSSKTMESKKVKGLYFIGEVVDVTGWLGGYNFQWAWSSGVAAGKHC
ncbi:MAG: NAD(P)/FAD-dependent oxidoreductase [Bacteroidetes bacterium]|nr:NAD(P)/FAD-dependent oxidoreductase [Bacteroidota bacterium]